MSHTDAGEIIDTAHAAFNRGDREAFVAFWAADCEYRPAMERDLAGDDGAFRGHDGIRRWWQGMAEAWTDWNIEVLELRDATRDRVLVSVILRARGRNSGVQIEAPFFQLGTIRGGKILASRDFSSRAEALEAAGLSASDAAG